VHLKPLVLDIVARMSSRAFVGEELCKDEDWLRLTKTYTVDMFVAAAELRTWPKSARRIVHWFLPACKQLRLQFSEARRIIDRTIQKRKDRRQGACTSENKASCHNDAITWAEQEAEAIGQKFDEAKFQLTMSVAAIHTTTDLLTQVMIDLAQHPEVIAALREEIGRCLGENEPSKAALHGMMLLDSVIKESQRLKPASIGQYNSAA